MATREPRERGMRVCGWWGNARMFHNQPYYRTNVLKSQAFFENRDCFNLVGAVDESCGAGVAPKERFQLVRGERGQKPVASR